ncbi:MAG TPA: hypothetical protein VK892_06965 [Pyrinomonadaceae bacterium]|nr:hypothetical protein [Pyrinomonadaceae bacterium]
MKITVSFCLIVFTATANAQDKPSKPEDKKNEPAPAKKANARPADDSAKESLSEPFTRADV